MLPFPQEAQNIGEYIGFTLISMEKQSKKKLSQYQESKIIRKIIQSPFDMTKSEILITNDNNGRGQKYTKSNLISIKRRKRNVYT
ncbi:hypothetical protein RCL_jg22538.t1 [Rhizophagus clarus]|nr:hypothetical protein RCL_jg22538.t1 [Rhizophagus clarus]